MRATEMHDLLKVAYQALLQNEVWRWGEAPFQKIKYCRYCSYSQDHGHGDNCVLARLERADSRA